VLTVAVVVVVVGVMTSSSVSIRITSGMIVSSSMMVIRTVVVGHSIAALVCMLKGQGSTTIL
jgi:hypothetical protein